VTQASNDKQNWAKLVEEIQQAKAAFDASPSGAPSASLGAASTPRGAASAPRGAAVVEPNPEFKPVLPPAAANIAQATEPEGRQDDLPPTAQSNFGRRQTSGFNVQEIRENLNQIQDSDDTMPEGTLPAPTSGIRSHLGWGVAGFVIGAIVWHLIGFWSFVGDVVLSKPENTTVVERSQEPSGKPRVLSYVKKRVTSNVSPASRNCSAFYRDEETGMARPAKCQVIVRSPGSIGATTNR